MESASTEAEVLYDVEDLLRFRNISCKIEEKVYMVFAVKHSFTERAHSSMQSFCSLCSKVCTYEVKDRVYEQRALDTIV